MFDRILMFTKGGTIIQHADMKVNMKFSNLMEFVIHQSGLNIK